MRHPSHVETDELTRKAFCGFTQDAPLLGEEKKDTPWWPTAPNGRLHPAQQLAPETWPAWGRVASPRLGPSSRPSVGLCEHKRHILPVA